MPLVSVENLSLAFGHLPLLDRVDLRIDEGERIGVIGRNGSGKSTLLRVLAGDTPPDQGRVWRIPGLRAARLDQEVPRGIHRPVVDEVADGLGALGALVAAYHRTALRVTDSGSPVVLAELGALQHQLEEQDGWRLEQRVELVLSRLGLPPDRLVDELSGGWRRRVLLAKALVAEPELLLLDEPTNHLDIDAIRWLEEHLLGRAGAVVFITHDRALLSRVATRIVELDRGQLTSWPGDYARYLERKAEALAVEADHRAKFDKFLAQEEAWIRQGVKARRTRNEGRVKALEALRRDRARRRELIGSARMEIDAAVTSGRMVFEAEGVAKSYGDVTVVRDFSVRILRGDRVGLIGPNGAGKTTVIRLLLGEIEPDEGAIRRGARLQVAYYDQEREQLDPERSVMDSVNDGNDQIEVGGSRRHVIGYLGDFLFSPERARSPVQSLSGGERNRLLLARLFARPANVLVLDEPTNDLDVETLELLEQRIAEFPGTLLLVSHDRTFLDNVVTSTLALEGDGQVVESVGGYEDWLRQREAASAQATEAIARGVPAGRRDNDAAPSAARGASGRQEHDIDRPRKLTFREQREFDGLPVRIATLEAEQTRLQHENSAPEFYKETAEHIRTVLARLDAIAGELDAAYARWAALEEIQAATRP